MFGSQDRRWREEVAERDREAARRAWRENRQRAKKGQLMRGSGAIGNSERRSRAIMTVPPGVKLTTERGVSMMLISATGFNDPELAAGVREAWEVFGGRAHDTEIRAALLAALKAMGFAYRPDGGLEK